jgi:hypothetical protein
MQKRCKITRCVYENVAPLKLARSWNVALKKLAPLLNVAPLKLAIVGKTNPDSTGFSGKILSS